MMCATRLVPWKEHQGGFPTENEGITWNRRNEQLRQNINAGMAVSVIDLANDYLVPLQGRP